MNTHLNKILLGIFTLITICFAAPLFAEPYLAFKNNMFCSGCHVNPIGGGARNTYGAYYGTNVLPQTAGSLTQFDSGNITESFRIGANFRANYTQVDPKQGESTQTFETQSGQVYLILQPKDSRFSLYIDEQLAPGGALNREAFILTKLSNNSFIKAGKLMLPYGIRLEDDTAFIRQATGFNFDNSDNGVEWDLQTTHFFISTAISNGSSGLTNNDKGLSYLSRVEYLGNNWRVGVSGVYNDADLGARSQMNMFGGFNWLGFTFLAEMDHIKDKSISHVPGSYEEQRISFLEVNRELTKGVNLKLTTEYLDPDTHINQNQRVRHSILMEYTPFANLQVRAGIRKGEDIPQKINGNYLSTFAQLHLYY
jgi:hypothetical protein